MRILVFDNYDSFTYNLVHLVRKLTTDPVDVFRNDEIPLEKVAGYDKIILSPGPGIPQEAGLLLPLIREYAASKSILGVCLGHQAIGEAFGARLINLSKVYHGIATPVHILNHEIPIFRHLPDIIQAGRYHSWVVDEAGLPDCLEITARDDEQYIMGLRHKQLDLTGVQFHPESVLTPEGENMIANWLNS
ncbi:anthranilate synthase component II [Thermoflavifilum thermophilum]|uniref:Anthranilate synthase component 2 n=1 Tax=Thermoflavifilum thermophilum TaxID=1393122 RepID=A0A1I7NH58_9BACT|nr:aminodeoxychorismate/anthranilate synthase component II [Thermoflavifilum thermophilum]SFV33973.1 anthranilate synthase component 2 [Thermoflavifilum thermophilum]